MPIIETALIVTSLVAAAIVLYWNDIRELFTESIIPWAKEHVSDEVEKSLRDIIALADGPISATRKKIKESWKTFNETFIDVSTKIEKIDSSTAKQTTTTFLKTEDGAYRKQVKEEIIGWEDIPDHIRSEMIKQKKKIAEYSTKEAVKNKVEKNLSEQGMEMTLA